MISQVPALRLLMSLGYEYLTPAEALALRGNSERQVLLEGVLAPFEEGRPDSIEKERQSSIIELRPEIDLFNERS